MNAWQRAFTSLLQRLLCVLGKTAGERRSTSCSCAAAACSTTDHIKTLQIFPAIAWLHTSTSTSTIKIFVRAVSNVRETASNCVEPYLQISETKSPSREGRKTAAELPQCSKCTRESLGEWLAFGLSLTGKYQRWRCSKVWSLAQIRQI